MPALRLFIKLAVYYAALALVVAALLSLFPSLQEYLPVGRVQALLTEGGKAFQKGQAGIQLGHLNSFWGSLAWLVSALLGARSTVIRRTTNAKPRAPACSMDWSIPVARSSSVRPRSRKRR